jgi:putative PIN family toxin of toxin-antitoxin system
VRCFIDTNILVSAGLFPSSVPAAALIKAVLPPNTAIVCDYSLNEMQRVINKKFSHKAGEFGLFLRRIFPKIELASTPAGDTGDESKIRDINDRPILRAAINAGADILLTGDKDFLESTVTTPQIITASQFLREY